MIVLYDFAFLALIGLAEFSSTKKRPEGANVSERGDPVTFKTTAVLDNNVAHAYFNRHLHGETCFLDEALAYYYISDEKNLQDFTKLQNALEKRSAKMKSRSGSQTLSTVRREPPPLRDASKLEVGFEERSNLFKKMVATRNKDIIMKIEPPFKGSKFGLGSVPGAIGPFTLRRLRKEVDAVDREIEKLKGKGEKEEIKEQVQDEGGILFIGPDGKSSNSYSKSLHTDSLDPKPQKVSTTKKGTVAKKDVLDEMVEKCMDKCKSAENPENGKKLIIISPTANLDETGSKKASSSKNKSRENASITPNLETRTVGESSKPAVRKFLCNPEKPVVSRFTGECSKGTSTGEDTQFISTLLRDWGGQTAFRRLFPTSGGMFTIPRNVVNTNSLNPALSFIELSKYCDLSPPHPGTIFDYKYLERLKLLFQIYDDEISMKLTATMKKAKNRKKKICGSKGAGFADSLCEVIRERYGWPPGPKVRCVQAEVNGYTKKVDAALCHFAWPKSSYKGNKRLLTSPITGRIFNSDKGSEFNLVQPHDFNIALFDSVHEYDYYIAKVENDDGDIRNTREVYRISTVNSVTYDGVTLAEFMDNDLTKIITMICKKDEEDEYLNAISMTTGYTLQKSIQLLTDIALYEYHLHFLMATPDINDRIEKKYREKMQKIFDLKFVSRISDQLDKPFSSVRFY